MGLLFLNSVKINLQSVRLLCSKLSFIIFANELNQPNLVRNAANPTRPLCQSFMIFLNFDSIQILIEKT